MTSIYTLEYGSVAGECLVEATMRERVQRSHGRSPNAHDGKGTAQAHGGTPGKRTLSEQIQLEPREGTTVQRKEREGVYQPFLAPKEPTSNARMNANGWMDMFSVPLATGTVMRSASGSADGGGDANRVFASATRGSGGAVPFQADMERAFGEDFSSVSAHVGQAHAMEALGAHAATQGETVAFATANPDKELVAHELTHVVQHRRSGALRSQASPSSATRVMLQNARPIGWVPRSRPDNRPTWQGTGMPAVAAAVVQAALRVVQRRFPPSPRSVP